MTTGIRDRHAGGVVRGVSRSMTVIAGAPPVAARVAIATIIGAMLIGVLLLRLWAMTVMNGATYQQLAARNQLRHLPVEAPRGAIVDRSGQPLVTNRAAREVVLNLDDVKRLDDADRDLLYRRLARVLGLRVGQVRQRIARGAPDPLMPVVIADDVTDDQVLYFLEEHATEFPGVDIRNRFVRTYAGGSVAAHVLGQVGEVSSEQLAGEYSMLKAGDHVGQSGLERQYDSYLRGVDGYDAVVVDAAGVRRPAEQGRGLPAVPGRTLRLSLDLGLQRATERAVLQGINIAHRSGEGRSANAGAAVAIDPRDGSVLALASYPTYDPNIFVGVGSDREVMRVLRDRRTPLSNRAVNGYYPPGSTFKVVTALAALKEGYISPSTPVNCPTAMRIAGTTFNNDIDVPLGAIDLRRALEVSCDTYFYYLALQFYNMPGSRLQSWAATLGFGAPTGIDLPGESGGLIPTPRWRRSTFAGTDRIWTPGHSVNLSIGQGDLLVTPLQMTSMYAALADGGKIREPRIALDVEDAAGKRVLELPRGKDRSLPFTDDQLAAIRDGLFAATHSPDGTASAVFSSFRVPMVGKTGTAEKPPYGDQAWFCGWAPVRRPTIAACAIIENGGHGGVSAAPVVLRMFQSHFHVGGGSITGERTD